MGSWFTIVLASLWTWSVIKVLLHHNELRMNFNWSGFNLPTTICNSRNLTEMKLYYYHCSYCSCDSCCVSEWYRVVDRLNIWFCELHATKLQSVGTLFHLWCRMLWCNELQYHVNVVSSKHCVPFASLHQKVSGIYNHCIRTACRLERLNYSFQQEHHAMQVKYENWH